MITPTIRKLTAAIKNGTSRQLINGLQRSTTFLSEKRTRVRFHAIDAIKEKSRKRKQFFPMITTITRKPTPTMETIHDDDKKRHVEATHQ
jgi:hypothetical protein